LERAFVRDGVLDQQVLLGRYRLQVLLDHFAFESFTVAQFELVVLTVLELAFHGSLFGVNPFQDKPGERSAKGAFFAVDQYT
jgi:hypothetical protein